MAQSEDEARWRRLNLREERKGRNRADFVERKRQKERGKRAVRGLNAYIEMQEPKGSRPVDFPDARLLDDAALAANIKALLDVDRYDWASHARPEQLFNKEDAITLCLAARGWGKGLPLGCAIPTPTGWTTMGELRVDDEVLDEAGRPCRVTFVTDTYVPGAAYEFTFSDGARVVSCDEHQWVSWTNRERAQFLRHGGGTRFPKSWASRAPRTTQDIVDTLTSGGRGDRNHCIPVTGALDLPKADLLIDPYILGYWLGDGNRVDGGFTCHEDDQPVLRATLEAAGYEIGATRPSYPQSFGTRGLRRDLRLLGVLNNKHVPATYLRGSIEQRTDLLAGLMDSDGFCDKQSGQVEFSSTDPALALGVFDLAVSLGQKPVIAHGRALLYGKDCGHKWRVTWRPTINPFRLARKAERVHPAGAQGLRNQHRMIVSAVPVEPVPMRCITVDSPNAMYLASRWMIPTHNTRACVEAVREACKAPNTRVAVIAADHVALRDVLFEGVSGFLACIPPSEIEHYKKGLGDIALRLKNGSIIVGFTAGNPDSVRGSSFSLLLCDEYAAWPRHKAQDMFDQARMTLRESENPRVIVATTPKRVPHILKLVEMAKDPELRIRVITGRSRDNTALTEDWFRQMEATYGNSRIGRQELEGELVMDAENALWTWDMIEHARRPNDMEVPRIIRAVIGIDPSGSKDGDATGLVVMGVDINKTLWVLENATTQGTPAVRYGAACRAAYRWGCREAVFETSYGGDNAAYGFQETWKNLQHSGEISAESSCPRMIPSRIKGDKAGRAMPVVNLYEAQLDNPERRRIWHDLPTESNGLVTLEDEQLSWSTESTKSPNCLDALVHVARYLARELGWEVNISAPGQNGPISPFSTRRRIGGGYNPYR